MDNMYHYRILWLTIRMDRRMQIVINTELKGSLSINLDSQSAEMLASRLVFSLLLLLDGYFTSVRSEESINSFTYTIQRSKKFIIIKWCSQLISSIHVQRVTFLFFHPGIETNTHNANRVRNKLVKYLFYNEIF